MTKLRVGIIGAGGAGRNIHAKSLQEYPDKYEVMAFCDADESQLRQAKDEYGSETYTLLDDFLAKGPVDLVVVATRPHSTHAELTVRSLEAGKHVIVEKPFAVTVAEAEAMIAARDRSGKTLTTHQNRRWDLDCLLVRQVLQGKRLGELRLLIATYWGGIGTGDSLYEWGSHIIDQCLWLVGGLPTQVMATVGFPDEEWDKHGCVSAALQYPNALLVQVLLIPQDRALEFPRFYAVGTEAYFSTDWVQVREDALRKHTKASFNLLDLQPDFLATPAWTLPTFYENVHDAIVNGAELVVKPEEGLDYLRVVEAILASARRGCAVAP